METKKLKILMLVDFMASSMGSTDDEYNKLPTTLRSGYLEV